MSFSTEPPFELRGKSGSTPAFKVRLSNEGLRPHGVTPDSNRLDLRYKSYALRSGNSYQDFGSRNQFTNTEPLQSGEEDEDMDYDSENPGSATQDGWWQEQEDLDDFEESEENVENNLEDFTVWIGDLVENCKNCESKPIDLEKDCRDPVSYEKLEHPVYKGPSGWCYSRDTMQGLFRKRRPEDPMSREPFYDPMSREPFYM